jgi:DNA-binding PadR family transcriptional regulator
MEDEGLCGSKLETSKGGPARRMYFLTDAGEAYLDFWVEALEQYRRNLDTFFRVYRRLPANNGHEKKGDEPGEAKRTKEHAGGARAQRMSPAQQNAFQKRLSDTRMKATRKKALKV